MPEVRTLPIAAEHREFTVKINGQAVERTYQLLSVTVTKAPKSPRPDWCT